MPHADESFVEPQGSNPLDVQPQLSGGDGLVFRARKKRTAPDLGFVGEIAASDPRWLEAIWKMDAVPVLSSLALGFDGEYYNINADEMAAGQMENDDALQCAISFVANTGNLYCACGRSLLRVEHRGKLTVLHQFSDGIISLAATPSYANRLIAVQQHGAHLVWGKNSYSAVTPFATDLAKPQVLLHPGGYLVAADRRRCEVFRLGIESLRLVASAALEDLGEIVAIVPAPLGNVFAICDRSGHLRQFKIPSVE